jgi:hypothetical protein
VITFDRLMAIEVAKQTDKQNAMTLKEKGNKQKQMIRKQERGGGGQASPSEGHAGKEGPPCWCD